MTRDRADEIIRRVFYSNIVLLPKLKDSEDAFYVGRMFGEMQKQLEIELSLEIDKENDKVED